MFDTTTRRAGLAALAAAIAVTIPTGVAHADTATGSISGHFTTSTGDPIANGFVSVLDADSWTSISGTQTDDSGAYSIPDLPPGDYIVQFDDPNGLTEYAPEASQLWNAGHVAVTAGTDTTVDEHALAAGTLAGTLLDADGNPAAGVSLNATNNVNYGYATTDDAGSWSMPVFADTGYMLSESLPKRPHPVRARPGQGHHRRHVRGGRRSDGHGERPDPADRHDPRPVHRHRRRSGGRGRGLG